MIYRFQYIIRQAIKDYCEQNNIPVTMIDFRQHYFEYYDETNKEVYVVIDYLNDIDLSKEIKQIIGGN